MGRNVLGFASWPIIGAIYSAVDSAISKTVSAATDRTSEDIREHARPDNMSQIHRFGNGPDGPGSFLGERASGTYNLIPGRALSAQTRLKNMAYELPADGWTINADGAPYLLRVPGIPGMTMNLVTQNQFASQPAFLQPLTNLQIQSDIGFMNKFRSAIFGSAAEQVQLQQHQQTMFPSIYGDGTNISVNMGG